MASFHPIIIYVILWVQLWDHNIMSKLIVSAQNEGHRMEHGRFWKGEKRENLPWYLVEYNPVVILPYPHHPLAALPSTINSDKGSIEISILECID